MWTAVGIALIASGLVIMFPLFGILLYQRNVLTLTDTIPNIPPIIAVSLWLFTGVVFLVKGLGQLVAARRASWFAIAGIASFSVFAIVLPIAITSYLDYQYAVEMNEQCFSDGFGWCGSYGLYPFELVYQNIIIFSISSIGFVAIGILSLAFRWRRRSSETAVATHS